MEIQIVEVENRDGSITEHIIIDKGNNEYTTMPKSVWDELNADTEGTR